MSTIIGQRKLRGWIDQYGVPDFFPKFLVIHGLRGAGKTTIAKYIAKKFNSPIYEPNELKVDDMRSLIEDSLTLSSNRFYLIANADDMTIQAQNCLLKFLEEPPKHAYIIMTVNDISGILPTIKSRASIKMMEPYSRTELKEFTDNSLILDIASNPGEVKRFIEIDYQDLYDYCVKVRDNIENASAGNVLNITKEVDKEDSYTAEEFCNMLVKVFHDSDFEPTIKVAVYKAIGTALSQLHRKGVMRVAVVDTMLLKIRAELRLGGGF